MYKNFAIISIADCTLGNKITTLLFCSLDRENKILLIGLNTSATFILGLSCLLAIC